MRLRARRLVRRLLRAVRPRRFRDTWLHRAVGERLFDRHLWVPDRLTFARAVALGTFIAVTPAVGVHTVLALLLAYAFRVNIPATVLASWAPAYLLYPFLHRFGMAVAGRPDVDDVTGIPRWLRSFMEHGQALWVGCIVFGAIAAGVAYLAAWHGWRWIGLVSPFHRREESLRRRATLRAVGAPAPAGDDGPDDDRREGPRRAHGGG